MAFRSTNWDAVVHCRSQMGTSAKPVGKATKAHVGHADRTGQSIARRLDNHVD
ncbi:hypothetical protein [Sphingomonas echinoides]|uniref:hypothetical protein n=1 Tax=Sphingomonas echinoides TaxID=59803 RepID=UPI0024139842|nr:hypothetical protein [Sphingomonas echinoides]